MLAFRTADSRLQLCGTVLQKSLEAEKGWRRGTQTRGSGGGFDVGALFPPRVHDA